MAKEFCLTKEKADELKKAAIAGEINIAKMYEMTSQQRREIFKKYVDEPTAIQVNAEFEKAMISEQQDALKSWAKNTFNIREKKSPTYKDVLNKIDELNTSGVLTPDTADGYLEDLVRTKLGVKITPEEAGIIAKRANELQELFKKFDTLGDPINKPQEQIDYLVKRREMEDYLNSLSPSSLTAIVTSTVSRGNMLWRIGSTLININSNNIEGAIGAIVRRIKERGIIGHNTDLMAKYIAHGMRIYSSTGYDISRIDKLESDLKILGENIVHSQGPGLGRKIGRFYEDIIFHATQGTPDAFMALLAFSDRATLKSLKIARHMGLRGKEAVDKAREMTLDAMSIESKTKEGKLIRQDSRVDAQRSTNTDKRFLADRLLKYRELLNFKDVKVGDMNIPFVKTTANSIQSQLELAGATVPVEVITRLLKTINIVKNTKGSWGEASQEAFTDFGDTMIRAGLGLTAGYLLAQAIPSQNFIGNYPTTEKEKELLRLKNGTPNSILIGDKWVSIDWFGTFGSPFLGFLTAKKYGSDYESLMYQYTRGVLFRLLQAPGIDYTLQTLTSAYRTLSSNDTVTTTDFIKQFANYAVDYTKSRLIPGFAQTLVEFLDDTMRESSKKEDILAPLKNVIPGLRQTLPEKKNVFGETTETAPWSNLFLGSRLKISKKDPIIDELSRLETVDQLPALTDIRELKTFKGLQQQIGKKTALEARDYFGKQLKLGIEELIQTDEYNEMDDEDKKKAIEKVKSDSLKDMLDTYGYEKPEKIEK